MFYYELMQGSIQSPTKLSYSYKWKLIRSAGSTWNSKLLKEVISNNSMLNAM